MAVDFVRMLYENTEYYNIVKNTIIKNMYYKTPEDIENCIHDVYLLIIEDKLKPEHENIKGWLYKASKNITRTHNRKISLNLKNIIELDEDTPSSYKLDFEVLENMEYKRVLNEILEECVFSTGDNKFINLKYKRNLSNDEISKILNIERDSVVKKATRIKSKIKKIINNRLT